MQGRPKSPTGGIGGRTPAEEQLDHLGGPEAAGFRQEGRVKTASDCLDVSAFVEKALHLREIPDPYGPGSMGCEVGKEQRAAATLPKFLSLSWRTQYINPNVVFYSKPSRYRTPQSLHLNTFRRGSFAGSCSGVPVLALAITM